MRRGDGILMQFFEKRKGEFILHTLQLAMAWRNALPLSYGRVKASVGNSKSMIRMARTLQNVLARDSQAFPNIRPGGEFAPIRQGCEVVLPGKSH